MADYSKFHFLRLFRCHSGQTVQEYIDECLRQKVRRLLAQGRTHKSIGETLGFSNPASFSRWYHTKMRTE